MNEQVEIVKEPKLAREKLANILKTLRAKPLPEKDI